ncbi:alpha/beta fold hydrolase [Tissierella praeacuta]|uniref:alpha/beta hydrolase family protein n=1 Tax=Tissierella praeacuta TaxID=43131 RepID=UPI003341AFC3
MKDYLYSNHIIEEKIYIENIPAILFRPKDAEGTIPTIIFYHGWSSNKESQRIRGLIFAAVGFQVLIPDGIYHGERGLIDYYKLDNCKYFWKTILNNLEESNLLIEKLIMEYKGDPNNIFLVGHSMGGFTAAGVFVHNPMIKSLIVLNGSCAWKNSNEIFKKYLGIKMTEELKEIEEKMERLDPYSNMELFNDRSVLMLHGSSDSTVSIESQRLFLQNIQPLYKDKQKIQLIEYPNLNHYVTTNMMEESISWLCKAKS